MEEKQFSLRHFESQHLANKLAVHDEGECAGIDCPYCKFEQQFSGKPYYHVLGKDERFRSLVFGE